MRKKGRLNQVGIALFLIVLLVSILTACGKFPDNTKNPVASSSDTAQSNTEQSDTENTMKPSESNHLSGVIFVLSLIHI